MSMNAHEKAVVEAAAKHVRYGHALDELGRAVDALHRSSRLARWREAEASLADLVAGAGSFSLTMKKSFAMSLLDAFREMLSKLEERKHD